MSRWSRLRAGLPWSQRAEAAPKLNQTITFASIPNQTYGALPLDLVISASSGLPVTVTTSGRCSVAADDDPDDGDAGPDDFDLTITGAGSCTVRATQAGNATYNSAFPANRTFSIARAPLTVTAPSASRPYKAANPALVPVISGFVNGDDQGDLSGSLTCTAFASQLSPVGVYPITCGGLFSVNYAISNVPGTLTILKIDQTITFDAIADKTFGAASFTISPTASSGLFISLAAVGQCTVPPGSWFGPITLTGVGPCTITAGQPGNNNYNAAPSEQRTFTINLAPLTITAQNKTMTQGGALPAFTVTLQRLCQRRLRDEARPLHDTRDLRRLPIPTDTDPHIPRPGLYTIECTGDAANYAETFVNATLTVNAP